jgi:DNA-binding GntR family transcriptional regulator
LTTAPNIPYEEETEDKRQKTAVEILGVTKSVYQYLRDQIITGELPASQKLNENQLASLLDISRPPLREAFRILEHEHLLVNIPRKGTYVAPISIRDLQEVYHTRKMIESYAIELLRIKNIRDLPQVAAALDYTSHLALPRSQGDKPEERLHYLMAFADFHVKLIEAAGNSRLIHFYNIISSNLARYQFMYVYLPGLTRNSQEEHHQILDYIASGAYDHAKEHLETHIDYFIKLLEPKITQETSKDAAIGAMNGDEIIGVFR